MSYLSNISHILIYIPYQIKQLRLGVSVTSLVYTQKTHKSRAKYVKTCWCGQMTGKEGSTPVRSGYFQLHRAGKALAAMHKQWTVCGTDARSQWLRLLWAALDTIEWACPRRLKIEAWRRCFTERNRHLQKLEQAFLVLCDSEYLYIVTFQKPVDCHLWLH
jgi:hypothetical protein